ncbi:MAG TPA: UDP-N-acetylglucosamine 2-epimerase (non-hydrolyzing) [Bryobacteraceae bacterium]|nr:UDP-N-acetylglucosamine 2-epimerase (non-hydrolyzing) [Bryobacteraceae bacterium]
MTKVLLIFGTRPEAIKLCPVLLHLRGRAEGFQVKCCVTAQHREMLDQVLQVFGVTPDYDLDLMLPGQTPAQTSARILAALEGVIAAERPDMVLVQGDTTTTFCGALAAFYARIPVGHVEAGLRTGDLGQPFPEELNRVLTTRMSALHFAPTEGAAENLRRDNVPAERILVTGNTGIDAVLQVTERLRTGGLAGAHLPGLDASRRLLVVTAHRRENHGAPLEAVCDALTRLARRGDVQIVYPVHRNPNVIGPVERMLGHEPNIILCPPLDYVSFIDLMRRAYLLITDSGGIQEEGPSLGKPVLVMREKTERPEAVEAGTVKLVGTCATRIVEETGLLLENRQEFERMSRAHNPYGDGHASERIGNALAGCQHLLRVV